MATTTLHTRCPYCRTTFRVLERQLASRQGQVRCGQCRKIFNGRAHLVILGSKPVLAHPEFELDEGFDPSRGPETMTLRRALEEAEIDSPPAETSRTHESTLATRSEEVPGAAGADTADSGIAEASFAWERTAPRKRWHTVVYALLSAVLSALLAWQAAVYYRSVIAAHFPALRPALQAYCDRFGCRLEPLRDAAALTIESSDLQADPAHKGLIILSVLLRNRDAYALAFPYLELALTDTQAQVVSRRVFTPQEYVRDPASVASGIGGGEERMFKLFLDASAVTAEGYKVERFYR